MATFTQIIDTEKPVLIDFYADWCQPYRMMKPILEELKLKIGDNVKIYKIDVDKNPSLAEKYNIRSIPTLMVFRNKEIVWQHAGITSTKDLEKVIQEICSNQN